ncbi:MAG: PhoH family protein [Alphaproteobacteria bacterium]|nr:PhoH family protein [Alphaproteobacteria bacterium]
MADDASVQLEFHDHSLIPLLFGDHDRNLARIEQKLGVKLEAFGNVVRILGAEDSLQAARGTLEGLYRRLEKTKKKGRDPYPFEIGDVDAAVKYAQAADAVEGVRDFAGDAGLETFKRPIGARSPNQAHYLKQLMEHELVFGLGPAGTGKTYLAVAMACAMLRAKRVDRLILSRPAVEAGERLGFLPGDMKDKVDPYLRPLYDALYDMMPGEMVERRLAAGEIEVAPLAFMRGRTLANSYVILDEAQNTTPTQMKMFLTRLGENSRMAVTGDLSQVDLPLGNKSGLRDALDHLHDVPGVGFVEFTAADVVRHPLVTRIVHAYNARDGVLLPGDKSR